MHPLWSSTFHFVGFSKAEELNLYLLYPSHNLDIEDNRRRNSDILGLSKCFFLQRGEVMKPTVLLEINYF